MTVLTASKEIRDAVVASGMEHDAAESLIRSRHTSTKPINSQPAAHFLPRALVLLSCGRSTASQTWGAGDDAMMKCYVLSAHRGSLLAFYPLRHRVHPREC
jgi:hypothetical protein